MPDGLGSLCFIEQLCSRTPDLFLSAVPAGELAPNKGIARETEYEEDKNKQKDYKGKFPHQEQNSCKSGDDEHKKIRKDLFPGDPYLYKLLRVPLWEQQGTQAALAKRTGFAKIVTVHAVPADQPELQNQNKNHVSYTQGKADLSENPCADSIDQEQYQVRN
jgi:hypothetical protein